MVVEETAYAKALRQDHAWCVNVEAGVAGTELARGKVGGYEGQERCRTHSPAFNPGSSTYPYRVMFLPLYRQETEAGRTKSSVQGTMARGRAGTQVCHIPRSELPNHLLSCLHPSAASQGLHLFQLGSDILRR